MSLQSALEKLKAAVSSHPDIIRNVVGKRRFVKGICDKPLPTGACCVTNEGGGCTVTCAGSSAITATGAACAITPGQYSSISSVEKTEAVSRFNTSYQPPIERCDFKLLDRFVIGVPCQYSKQQIERVAQNIAMYAVSGQWSQSCIEKVTRSVSDLFNKRCGNAGKGMLMGIYKDLRSSLTRRGIIKMNVNVSKPNIPTISPDQMIDENLIR